MPYYPKSRIIPNQKSNPGEFITQEGKEYLGDYYITFDGKYFTGKNPQSKTNFPLTKIDSFKNKNELIIPNQDLNTFNRLNKSNSNLSELLDPIPYYPIPSENDYLKGNIIRYFAQQRKIRIFKIIEIDKNTYLDISQQKGIYNYPMWKVISLFWQISGPLEDERPNGYVVKAGVLDTNKRIVEKKDKVFQGLKQYITDYKQFYK